MKTQEDIERKIIGDYIADIEHDIEWGLKNHQLEIAVWIEEILPKYVDNVKTALLAAGYKLNQEAC